jgi:hypothetical protein
MTKWWQLQHIRSPPDETAKNLRKWWFVQHMELGMVEAAIFSTPTRIQVISYASIMK